MVYIGVVPSARLAIDKVYYTSNEYKYIHLMPCCLLYYTWCGCHIHFHQEGSADYVHDSTSTLLDSSIMSDNLSLIYSNWHVKEVESHNDN